MPSMNLSEMSEHLLWLLDGDGLEPRWEEPILVTRRELTAALTLVEFLHDDLGVIPEELAAATVRVAHDLAVRDPEVEAAIERRTRSRGTEPPNG